MFKTNLVNTSGAILILLFFGMGNPGKAGSANEAAGPGTVAADPVTVNDGKIEVLDFNAFEHWLYKETDSVYVINFWATWCAPCVREIPAFEKLHEVYGPEKVKVVLVSLDFPNQLESRVLPFMDRMDMQSRVILLDDPYSNRWIGRVSEEWSGAIPATVIYSKDYRGFFEREFKFEELEEIIKPLIQ